MGMGIVGGVGIVVGVKGVVMLFRVSDMVVAVIVVCYGFWYHYCTYLDITPPLPYYFYYQNHQYY